MSDKQNVERAKKGDKKAFQKLIEKEKIKLYKIAYIYTKNENDALDIFQETIYKALTSIHKLNDGNYFSTWITRILINNAKNYLNKKKRDIPMELHSLSKGSVPFQTSVEDKLDILEALYHLEEREKNALILRFYKDYTISQIAQILDIPEGSVKSTIHRALKKLKGNIQGGIVNG